MTYTDEEKIIVINRLDEGNSIKAICNEYGAARSTLYCPYPDRRTGKTVVNWKGKSKNHGTEKDKKGDAAPPWCDETFKAGAVRLVTERGRQPTDVAKELGICIDTLRSWLKASVIQMGQASRIDIQLTLASLDMACHRRKPSKGIIFHSGRGVQYAARAYRERLETYGICQSMSRRGDPYDNAVSENFLSCLKCELIHLEQYPTRAAAQNDVFA